MRRLNRVAYWHHIVTIRRLYDRWIQCRQGETMWDFLYAKFSKLVCLNPDHQIYSTLYDCCDQQVSSERECEHLPNSFPFFTVAWDKLLIEEWERCLTSLMIQSHHTSSCFVVRLSHWARPLTRVKVVSAIILIGQRLNWYLSVNCNINK